MISCKFCGNENMDNAQQCYICGKSLASAQISGLVNIGDQPQSQQYHGVNDNLPYGSNVQVATRFQSDTGGGAHSGPTQQTFGAQMMAGTSEKKKGSAKTVIAVILMLAALGLLVWYLCFSEYAIIHF